MARLVRGRQHYYEENWATKKTILRAIVLDEKSANRSCAAVWRSSSIERNGRYAAR